MKKITEVFYTVASSCTNLAENVNELIDNGWQPKGTPFPRGTYIVQMIVKYE